MVWRTGPKNYYLCCCYSLLSLGGGAHLILLWGPMYSRYDPGWNIRENKNGYKVQKKEFSRRLYTTPGFWHVAHNSLLSLKWCGHPPRCRRDAGVSPSQIPVH